VPPAPVIRSMKPSRLTSPAASAETALPPTVPIGSNEVPVRSQSSGGPPVVEVGGYRRRERRDQRRGLAHHELLTGRLEHG
jgi:hypothetical protein